MTVSRVVNGEPNVRPGTRDKVLAAVAAMGYQAHPQTPRVQDAEPITIGMVYYDPSVGYLNDFLIGLLSKASLRHVHLDVRRCESRDDEEQLVSTMLAGRLDGIIMAPPFCDAERLLQMAIDRGTLAVAVSSGRPYEKVCAVGIDDHRAAYEMTRHLLSLGHRRLGFILGDRRQHCSERRRAGFFAALHDAGLVPEEVALIAEGDFSYRSALDAAEELLSSEQRPTAIFASNDDMAAAAVAIAHRKGLEVPSDLTVVGIDDAPLATTIWPELTTIRQPIPQMAGVAVDLLVRHIRARRAGEVLPCEHALMPFELIRRQSDAAPRARPQLRVSAVG